MLLSLKSVSVTSEVNGAWLVVRNVYEPIGAPTASENVIVLR
jgi:hypothetical protein